MGARASAARARLNVGYGRDGSPCAAAQSGGEGRIELDPRAQQDQRPRSKRDRPNASHRASRAGAVPASWRIRGPSDSVDPDSPVRGESRTTSIGPLLAECVPAGRRSAWRRSDRLELGQSLGEAVLVSRMPVSGRGCRIIRSSPWGR